METTSSSDRTYTYVTSIISGWDVVDRSGLRGVGLLAGFGLRHAAWVASLVLVGWWGGCCFVGASLGRAAALRSPAGFACMDGWDAVSLTLRDALIPTASLTFANMPLPVFHLLTDRFHRRLERLPRPTAVCGVNHS